MAEQQQWIPCEEQLPGFGEWVLLAWDGSTKIGNARNHAVHFELCYREPENSMRDGWAWVIAADSWAEIVNKWPPTHWMPLPSPPGAE